MFAISAVRFLFMMRTAVRECKGACHPYELDDNFAVIRRRLSWKVTLSAKCRFDTGHRRVRIDN